jgi:hypothetical protein
MTAAANEYALLITKPGTPDVEVGPEHVYKDGSIVSSVQYQMLRARSQLKGAQLIDHECNVWKVNDYRVTRLASPSEVGVSVVGYLCLLLFGWLMLAWPVKVKLELTPLYKWDLPTVKRHVVELVERNPDAYVHETGTRLRRLITTCRSVRCIGAAIMGNPTPNES